MFSGDVESCLVWFFKTKRDIGCVLLTIQTGYRSDSIAIQHRRSGGVNYWPEAAVSSCAQFVIAIRSTVWHCKWHLKTETITVLLYISKT